MDLWFKEIHHGSIGFCLKVKQTLFSGESEFQKLDIIDTEAMGRVMLLDGLVMLTEKDEFIYHEMIAHVPLCVHPAPKQVLIIGGGDGGTVREIIRHPGVEHIDLVEIDKMVVDQSLQFFPDVANQLNNPKVTIHYKDGITFVREHKNFYDLIIIDSTDPIGPAVGLVSKEFYADCHQALKENGLLTAQTEGPFFDEEIIKPIYRNLSQFFLHTRMYLSAIPSYPGGYWSFAFASKKYQPLMDINKERADLISQQTRFYNSKIHAASFALPNFVKEFYLG